MTDNYRSVRSRIAQHPASCGRAAERLGCSGHGCPRRLLVWRAPGRVGCFGVPAPRLRGAATLVLARDSRKRFRITVWRHGQVPRSDARGRIHIARLVALAPSPPNVTTTTFGSPRNLLRTESVSARGFAKDGPGFANALSGVRISVRNEEQPSLDGVSRNPD